MRHGVALSLSLVTALVFGCGGDDTTSTDSETTTHTSTVVRYTTPYPTDAALGLRQRGYRVGKVNQRNLNFPDQQLPERLVNDPRLVGALKIHTRYGSLTFYDYSSFGRASRSADRVPGHVIARYGAWIAAGSSGVSRSDLDSLGLRDVFVAPIGS